MKRMWRIVRLTGVVALTLAATGGPLACGGKSATGSSGCCKVCRTGKACGDTCIQASDTCHQPTGCACNGWQSPKGMRWVTRCIAVYAYPPKARYEIAGSAKTLA